jgi:phage shock protein C
MRMNRRLYRSRTDSMLGGVAGGLADYLGADPALVRVAWALVIVLTGGAALLAYIVAWIVVPEAPAGPASAGPGDAEPVATADPVTGARTGPADLNERPLAPAAGRPMSPGLLVGGGLVLLGLWFLAREYLPPIDWSLVWPVVLIGVGALILLSSARNRAR